MSLAAGYLLAELLSEAEGGATTVSEPLRQQIEQKRAQLTGLSRNQRAATLVAALRSPPADRPVVTLPPKIWQRLCDVKLTHETRVARELLELERVMGAGR